MATQLESAIRGMDSSTLERLIADLLADDYEVEPTSTSGPDNGRDAFVKDGDEEGIVHCSVQKDDIEDKIWDDAETAAEHDAKYDFFIFCTTQDRATVMRDRMEQEISEEYGFRTRILDFEHIRNKLMGNQENHHLAREHLGVDPAGLLKEVKSQLDQIEGKEKMRRLANQPRLSIDSWKLTPLDELGPLMGPESIVKTQTQLSFRISNVGKGNAYNLRSCLYVKPIDDLSSPPVKNIQEEILSAGSTSKLRRSGREPERDPKNHLESSESANFLSNTFVYMHGRKGNAFAVDATGPPAPGTTMPDGLAVGIKLMYDDEFKETHEKVIFAAVGEVPMESLREFFKRMKGIVEIDESEPIFPEEIHFR